MKLLCECGRKSGDGVIKLCGAHVQKLLLTPDQMRDQRAKEASDDRRFVSQHGHKALRERRKK